MPARVPAVTARPVVVLHGFAGHAESWDTVVAALGERRVEAITLFGHDHALPPDGPIAFEDEVARVADRVRAVGEPVLLCGYSMGGRVALGVLARVPERVASVVLVGAHPGLGSDAEREARAIADELWVRVLVDEGIEAFTSKWQAQPLFATQARLDPERLQAQRAIRLRHDPRALALAMTSLGLARMPSYWSVVAGAVVPIELVVGEHDAKFAALADRMQERMRPGLGRVRRISDSGHNVLLERPDVLVRIIAER